MKTDAKDEYKKSPDVYVKQMVADRCRDLVISDNIRKELTIIERKAEQNWQRFECLHGENFKKLFEEYLGAEAAEKYKKKLQAANKTSDWPKIPLDDVKPSPEMPRTSSSVVGWRSSVPECNLEVFGRLYVSPKNTVIPLVSDDVTHQQFIILG